MSDTTPPPGPGQDPNQPPPPPHQGPYGGPPPQQGGYGAPPPQGGPYYGGGGHGSPPPNHLVWAILSTLFCCLPLGIASIVFAAQVNSKWSAGDFAGAQDASNKAKNFALWGTIIGAIVIVIYILLTAVGASSMDNSQL